MSLTIYEVSLELYDGGQDDDTMRPKSFHREYDVIAGSPACAEAAGRSLAETLHDDADLVSVDVGAVTTWGEGRGMVGCGS